MVNSPFGKLPGGLGGILKAAEEAKKADEEFAAARIEGQAGDGAVRVVVNGKAELLEIKIQKAAVDPNDIETLEALILVAVRQASDKAAADREEKLRAIIPGGLGGRLPGGFFQ